MNEIVKRNCACELGYDKGALKKTIENNIFTIFGNLNQKNSIVIRYHGILTEHNTENTTTFNMFYYFDGLENDKKTIKLQKCTKCLGECYCATIALNDYHYINFGFFDENNNHEPAINNSFKLDIATDPISSIMQRYGFEQNTNLPTNIEDKENLFENILMSIKDFFKKLLKKQILNKKVNLL